MKVVFSNFDDIKNPHYGGGGAIAIHEVAKRLVKKYKMSVCVITGSYTKSRDEFHDGVEYRRIGTSFLGPRLGQLIYQVLLPCTLLGCSFDVWLESFTPPFSTAFLPLFTRKPVIGLAHLFGGSEMKRKYGVPFDVIESVGIRCYRYCIAVSDFASAKISTLNPACQVTTIQNGVDRDFFHSETKSKEHILFVGRIEADQKGLDLLLEAYASVESILSTPLLIVGTGTEKEVKKVNLLAESLGISNRVKFLGRVSDANQKKDLFCRAAAVVMPSRYETLPLVALEALASDTPLITFDIDGMQWIPDSVAMKVKPFDTKRLGMAMGKLLTEDGEWDRLSEEGKKFARRYDWDVVADQYAFFLRKIVSEPKV